MPNYELEGDNICFIPRLAVGYLGRTQEQRMQLNIYVSHPQDRRLAESMLFFPEPRIASSLASCITVQPIFDTAYGVACVAIYL